MLDMQRYYVTIGQVHLINIDRLQLRYILFSLSMFRIEQLTFRVVPACQLLCVCVGHKIVFNLRSCRMQTIDMVDREK